MATTKKDGIEVAKQVTASKLPNSALEDFSGALGLSIARSLKTLHLQKFNIKSSTVAQRFGQAVFNSLGRLKNLQLKGMFSKSKCWDSVISVLYASAQVEGLAVLTLGDPQMTEENHTNITNIVLTKPSRFPHLKKIDLEGAYSSATGVLSHKITFLK